MRPEVEPEAVSALLSPGHQLLLATWLSPAFPVGGFSYSHGLEAAIAEGRVGDSAGLAGWLEDLVRRGSGWTDAVLLAEAWRGAADASRLAAVADLAVALAPSLERRLETTALGAAFLRAADAGWPNTSVAAFAAERGPDGAAYPVAVGLATAVRGVPLEPVAAAFLNGFAATLVSVAVRLVPLGQSAGLGVLAGLGPAVLATARAAAASTLDDLGSATLVSDIAAMRHETLHIRLFRS